jgi:hypothetical protein
LPPPLPCRCRHFAAATTIVAVSLPPCHRHPPCRGLAVALPPPPPLARPCRCCPVAASPPLQRCCRHCRCSFAAGLSQLSHPCSALPLKGQVYRMALS